jgi:hypothetical protein
LFLITLCVAPTIAHAADIPSIGEADTGGATNPNNPQSNITATDAAAGACSWYKPWNCSIDNFFAGVVNYTLGWIPTILGFVLGKLFDLFDWMFKVTIIEFGATLSTYRLLSSSDQSTGLINIVWGFFKRFRQYWPYIYIPVCCWGNYI